MARILRKAIVIINEQHSLFPEQKEILNKEFDSWSFIPVPAEGWTLDEMKKKMEEWSFLMFKDEVNVFVFASPIPVLIKHMTEISYNTFHGKSSVKVFHNDHREKKELPSGKIIQTVSATGWQLI